MTLRLASVAAVVQFPAADAAASRHRVQARLAPLHRRVRGVEPLEVRLAARTRGDPLGGHLARGALARVADGLAAVVVAVEAAAARSPAAVREGHVGGGAGGGPVLLAAVTFWNEQQFVELPPDIEKDDGNRSVMV